MHPLFLTQMISRTRSFFSLGDQEGDTKERGDRGHGVPTGEPVPTADLVGLRLLVHRPDHETGVVVARSAVRYSTRVPVARPPQRHYCSTPELSFLRACHLCNKELSPLQDIYMYRGDQGFCSVECRRKHMLLDERREQPEAEAGRGRRPAAPPRLRCAGHRIPSSDHRRGRMSVAT